jgi:hypothetical protein
MAFLGELLGLIGNWVFEIFSFCIFYFIDWYVGWFEFKVHITQGDHVGKAVIVSWVTVDEPGSSAVVYWSENSKDKKQANGKVVTYKYYTYTSGFIHHTTIRNLKVTENFDAIASLYCYNIIPLFLFCFCSASIWD